MDARSLPVGDDSRASRATVAAAGLLARPRTGHVRGTRLLSRKTIADQPELPGSRFAHASHMVRSWRVGGLNRLVIVTQ